MGQVTPSQADLLYTRILMSALNADNFKEIGLVDVDKTQR